MWPFKKKVIPKVDGINIVIDKGLPLSIAEGEIVSRSETVLKGCRIVTEEVKTWQ
jgi:hypothetical protein